MPQLAGGGRTGREKKRAVRGKAKGLPVPAMKTKKIPVAAGKKVAKKAAKVFNKTTYRAK